jgi:exonuclease SbcC
MRILAIRAQNLASLPSFELDLLKSPLAKTRIFAITGPTGAGKSTLLDALCLALYDRAPRLSGPRDVPVGEMEVPATDPRSLLRRGASEAFAEVDFTGKDQQRYRARWEVWRARKRSDGRIQNQRMRLESLDQKRELTGATKTETLALIEELIGLSFDEFRRAVLLAQGDFATFLRAKTDERAELLEKMTGTEIYAEISRAAFQRAKLENDRLLQLEVERDSLLLLAGADRRALEADIAALAMRRAEAEAILAGERQEVAFLELALALAGEIAEKVRALQEAHQDLEEGRELAEDLARTERAERLRAAFESLSSAEKKQSEAAAESALASEAAEAAERERITVERNVAGVRAEIERQGERERIAQPEIEKARALDVRIEEAGRALESVERTAAEVEARALEARSARDRLLDRHEQRTHELESLRVRLEQQKDIASIAPQWPRWKAELERHAASSGTIAELSLERRRASERLEAGRARIEQASTSLTRADEAIARLRRQSEQSEESLAVHRRAHPREAIDAAIERIARELESIDSMRSIHRELRRLERQHAEESAIEVEEHKASGASKQASAAAKEKLHVLERELAALIASKDSAETLALLHARRQTLLVEGEPCPLCGSRDHPFTEATENGEIEVAWVQELRSAEKKLASGVSSAEAEAQAARLAQTSHEEAKERARARAQQIAREIAAKKSEWSRRLEALELIWLDSPLLAKSDLARLVRALPSLPSEKGADRRLETARRSFEDQRSALREAARTDQELAAAAEGLRADLDRAQVGRRALEPELEHARVDARAIEDQATRLDAELTSQEALLAELRRRLEQPLRANADWLVRLEREGTSFIHTLATRVSEHELDRAKQSDLTEALRGLDSELQAARVELERRSSDARLASEGLAAARSRSAELLGARREVFGGRALPEVLEEIEGARKRLAASAERWNAEEIKAKESAARSEERMRGARASYEEARQTLAETHQRFERSLAESGLERSEVERLLARDHSWMDEARRVLDELRERATRLESALEDRRARRAAHWSSRGEPIPSEERTEEARRAAAEQLAETERRTKELVETEASKKTRLALDDDMQKKLAALEPRIAEQKRMLDRWSELSLVIGSADGKKLRSFAQGLTLDALIDQANAHLRQLRPRYRLQRVPGFDMELQVIDGDMGDEVRAVATLSGGEAFLVSLALALGLSSISSRNVSIRSLFIDEGFGSLDREALEAALSTLDQLQADGRTIGLISHIPEVAERVGFQVQVRPTGPGRSEVVVVA